MVQQLQTCWLELAYWGGLRFLSLFPLEVLNLRLTIWMWEFSRICLGFVDLTLGVCLVERKRKYKRSVRQVDEGSFFYRKRKKKKKTSDTNHANNVTKPDTKSGNNNPRSFKFEGNRDPLLSETRTLIWWRRHKRWWKSVW